MGLFRDLFTRKPPLPPPKAANRGGRPTRSEAAEKRRQILMDKKLQLDILKADMEMKALQERQTKPLLTIETMMYVVDALATLGLEVRPAGGGPPLGQSGLAALLKELIPMLGPRIGHAIRDGMSPQGQAVLAQRLQIPAAAPQPPAAPPPQQPEDPEPPDEEAQMSLVQGYLTNVLGGKSPAERAQWLSSQTDPTLQQLLTYLCQSADGQLMTYLGQVAQQVPEYRPVAGWVMAQGEVWIVETVRELRRIRSAAGPNGQVGRW